MPLNGFGVSALLPEHAASAALSATADQPGVIGQLGSKTAYLLYVLGDRVGEYLFFIGCTYIFLLLLQRKRWIYAALALASALVWLTFHLPVSLYLESLGADSFAETRNFDLDEARFWLQTLGEAIRPMFSLKKMLFYLALSLASFWLLKRLLVKMEFTRRHALAIKSSVSVLLIGLALQHTTAQALGFYFRNSEVAQATEKNFDNPAPGVEAGSSNTNLLVYIGESTSVMNMGLYGYPRNTTPMLGELARTDERLIVFENVFSTHAHTRSSLLEAFSFALDAGDDHRPITQRRRSSLIDVLRQGGLDSTLISNQGVGGLWDQTASVIFKNSEKIFRTQAHEGGAGAQPAARSWDDEFFDEQLNAIENRGGAGRRIVFLHSYAGHGPYHDNIPPRFRVPVDDVLARLQSSQIRQDITQSTEAIERYDAAVRYVDHSVSKTIERVKASPRPFVFVYFSDHGEAVYPGRGHDSARFMHEMVRVPLILYFNDAARQENPRLFDKYRLLAKQKEPATLAQLSSTLLDLLGIGFRQAQDGAVSATPVIGDKTELAPIMIRETAEGTTFLNLNAFVPQPAAPLGPALIDKTDKDTQVFVAVRSGQKTAQEACQAYAATFEDISRGILVAGCPARSPSAADPKS